VHVPVRYLHDYRRLGRHPVYERPLWRDVGWTAGRHADSGQSFRRGEDVPPGGCLREVPWMIRGAAFPGCHDGFLAGITRTAEATGHGLTKFSYLIQSIDFGRIFSIIMS